MRRSVPRYSSLLLQHIHRSLPVLRRLYPSSSSIAAVNAAFPPDPKTPEQGDDVLRFFCAELGMGERPLRLWRDKLHQRVQQRWGIAKAGEGEPAAAAMEWTPLRTVAAASTRWLRPRPQDAAVVRSALRNLKFLVSPLLLLSPPPCERVGAPASLTRSTVGAEEEDFPPQLLRPTTHAECSRWYATQPIPAGMFLMSIPTEAVLFANPPPASDPLLGFFMHVEELVAQLVDAAATEDAAHHGYVSYLCDSVVPCANLPFLSLPEMQASFAQEAAALDSPALSLLAFFHTDMAGEPLSDFLRARLSKDEYAWWVSLVLAHRAGASSLLPMIDKLNHSPLPNSYYTMATEDTLCGLDVLDNLFAGVPAELLYQPYVHVFAIRDIAAGEELTLCYASAAAAAYRPAGQHPPRRPASLQLPEVAESADASHSLAKALDGGGEVSDHNTIPTADMHDVMEGLFSTARGNDQTALAQLQHPGRQEVSTAEGSATWRLQWGFVPPCDAVYSATDLMEMAGLVAERRVDTRSLLFPPPSPRSSPAAPTA